MLLHLYVNDEKVCGKGHIEVLFMTIINSLIIISDKNFIFIIFETLKVISLVYNCAKSLTNKYF